MHTKPAIRDLLLLSAVCWVLYLPGLTAAGLTNWQEAQRAVVAREMQARGEWLVPTIHGRPYLAKPPMVYWCQLALAGARGTRTGEFELRATVALAGWAGVLATYLAACRLFRRAGGDASGAVLRNSPRWAGLFLATGPLYVNSSRIGELDILLVPFTVIAIAAIFECWRSLEEHRRANWPLLIVAAVAGSCATLTKGPPALVAIAVAGYGGIIVRCAMAGVPEGSRRTESSEKKQRWSGAMGSTVGALMLPAIACTMYPPRDASDFLGIALFGVFGAILGGVFGGLAGPGHCARCIVTLARTHAWATIGVPMLAYGGWLWAASRQVGSAVVASGIASESADNVRLFVPDSPLTNLEAAAYGAGLGSVCAAAALIWIARRRIVLGSALSVLVAWTVGGIIAFSILGKGVPRYLTPLWPGMSMLGAAWYGDVLRRWKWGRWMRGAVIAVLVILGAVELWWFGWGRELTQSDRSPRGLIAELLGLRAVQANQLGMFEFDTPAVEFYAGVPVPSYLDTMPRPGLVGVGPLTIAHLAEQLKATRGDAVLLVRRTQPPGQDPVPAIDRLRAAELKLDPIPHTSRFVIDNGRTEIIVVRVQTR